MPRLPAIVIATSRAVVNAGLEAVLSGRAKIVGVVTTGKQAVAMAKDVGPDVVLLGDRLIDGDWLEVADAIVAGSKARVVMIGAEENPAYVARASAAGVSDYVFESVTPRALVAAVAGAAAGMASSSLGLFGNVHASLQSHERVPTFVRLFTAREEQVVRHLAYGLSNHEIARSLGISIETVKEHIQKILRKTASTDRTQVAVWAVRSGLG